MTIPVQYVGRLVYHFSHIDNLPGLLRDNFLATNHPLFPIRHRSIAASGIQERRARMLVSCAPGHCVHDYVPLYFGSLSPMLLSVLHTKNIDQCDILYFEFPIELVNQPDTVFTDASANTSAPPNFYSDPSHLDKLDWDAIDSLKWSNPDDNYRHRRMAEMLVLQQLSLTDAVRCVVWNEKTKKHVEQVVGNSPFPTIQFESKEQRHFYTNIELKDNSSLIIGPNEIAGRFSGMCQKISEHLDAENASKKAQFEDLNALLLGLRANFGCIPYTAELVGLKSANGIHKQTVDVHTLDVVQRLIVLDEYTALDDEAKKILEIAAYLHDIGKGPQSRWVTNGGMQRVDPNHPVGALPMLLEILTGYIQTFNLASAKQLLKLVCYHDLVGDVLGRGRNEQQIIDVVEDETELAMLFAIGKADATSLVEQWWDQSEANQLYDRCLAAIK